MPSQSSRKDILKIHMKNKPLSKDVDIDKIVALTENFSGAELLSVVNTAVSSILQAAIEKYPKPEYWLKKVEEIQNQSEIENKKKSELALKKGNKEEAKQYKNEKINKEKMALELGVIINMEKIENAIKKVKSSRDGKPKEKTMSPTTVPYYR